MAGPQESKTERCCVCGETTEEMFRPSPEAWPRCVDSDGCLRRMRRPHCKHHMLHNPLCKNCQSECC